MVNSCNESQYAYKLNQLKAESVQAYNDFMSKCPQAFCKSLISITSKSDMIENNICETFNGYILKSRDKPLIEMLEAIRTHLMMRIWNISQQLSAKNDLLCKNVTKKLEKLKKLVKYCKIRPSGKGMYEVICFDETYIVDLPRRQCSCRQWELTGIPCCHAISCIFHARQQPYDYVDKFFYNANCKACYEHVLQPISGVRSWPVVNASPILPPPFIKNPGRPKKCRKRDAYEFKKQSATKLARI